MHRPSQLLDVKVRHGNIRQLWFVDLWKWNAIYAMYALYMSDNP